MSESVQTGRNANESLKFVQLSDLHLTKPSLINPLRLFNKRVLGYLSWLRRRRHTHQRWILESALQTFRQLNIDHFTITGDLTHIGLEMEFKQARSWLEQLGAPKDVTVIPGNHDLYVNERWARSFNHWQDYLIGDDLDVTLPNNSKLQALDQLTQLYPIVRKRKNVAFICLNSVFDAPWFRATGQIHHQQLERLTFLLSSSELKNYCKIILIHHPVTLTNTPDRKRLINHLDLVSIIQKNPVDLILHGHGHHSCHEIITTFDGSKIPIIGMSSSSSTSQKSGYEAEFLLFHVIKKYTGWEVTQQKYRLDMKSKNFLAQQKKIII